MREQKQAEQRTQMEEMENELQQTKDQKVRLEVNRQARKTQPVTNPTAKEKVRKQKQAE